MESNEIVSELISEIERLSSKNAVLKDTNSELRNRVLTLERLSKDLNTQSSGSQSATQDPDIAKATRAIWG